MYPCDKIRNIFKLSGTFDVNLDHIVPLKL